MKAKLKDKMEKGRGAAHIGSRPRDRWWFMWTAEERNGCATRTSMGATSPLRGAGEQI